MGRNNKRKEKRSKNLVLICTLTAIILIVSTYAWFIGLRSVSVASFDVEIASTDSLLLSLDGKKWSTQVNINKGNYNDPNVVYSGNTNSWTTGLIPMSTVGNMDEDTSRMVLFEKASFTATKGGYRVMASKVDNATTEHKGYVAFDLFVKNFSGTKYIKEYNPLDEEAIYLTTDSSVTVPTDGVKNTGIENSVRVAFAQVGRVSGTTTTVDTITGIKCQNDANVTSICRQAQIWEPNDTQHVESAINWYNTSCKVRTDKEIEKDSAYSSTNCTQIQNGLAYPTYAIKDNVASSDYVDIYDGNQVNGVYNNYNANLNKVTNFPYFTDTMKNLPGLNRPQLMTLAPNSITKLRVYIYIEGQDVDNYDFAQIGKKIAVNFGFTKERFETEDVGYTGPSFNVPAPNNNIVYELNN